MQSRDAQTVPAPGWYPDPGGSGGLRWWDGTAWTPHIRLAEPTQPAAIPVTPVAPEPLPYAGDPRFGGPAGAAGAAGAQQPYAPGAHTHAAAAHAHLHASLGPTPGRGRLLVYAAAVLAVLVLIAVVVKLVGSGDDGTPAPETSGGGLLSGNGQSNPQVAAMRSDVISIASAEEDAFAQSQAYVAATSAAGTLVLAGQPLRLSAPGELVTVKVNQPGTAYCIVARRVPAGGGAPQTAVYLSSAGGLSTSLAACPPSF